MAVIHGVTRYTDNNNARLLAGHPTAANILMVAIVLIGLAVLPTLNRETFPEIQASEVMVTAPSPAPARSKSRMRSATRSRMRLMASLF